MKISCLRLVCAFLLFFSARISSAQGCRLDYTPHYDVYQTVTSDQTHIYTTVLTDGSTSGNGSAGCNYPNATHTASTYNKLGSTTVTKTAPGYMNSYVSAEADQSIVGVPGLIDFEGNGSVICSVFGTFFSSGFHLQLEFAVTKVKTNESDPNTNKVVLPDGTINCQVNSYCSSATTPPDCPVNFITQRPDIPGQRITCSLFYNVYSVAERTYSTHPWTCIPAIPPPFPSSWRNSDPTLGTCTHNP